MTDTPSTWGHEVRTLTTRERFDAVRCSIDGCDDTPTHETSWYYRAARDARTWKRRYAVCPAGAVEFSKRHLAPIRDETHTYVREVASDAN